MNNKETKQSFLKKIKTDKKFKAKVELIGYIVVVVLIVIYINISNIGKNYDYNNVLNNNITTNTNVDENKSNLLEELNDNYNYNINISITKKKSNDQEIDYNSNELENIDYSYSGKSYEENIIINKIINDETTTYYKVESEYYTKENEEYKLTDDKIIYDYLSSKYIELENVKKYITASSLDHVTDYSSGKKEYVYNLKVSDIIKTYKENDLVEINIVIENDTINMTIDYTKLLKLIDTTITNCKINYTYTDINEIEEFTIIENITTNNEEGNSQTN